MTNAKILYHTCPIKFKFQNPYHQNHHHQDHNAQHPKINHQNIQVNPAQLVPQPQPIPAVPQLVVSPPPVENGDMPHSPLDR